MFNKHFFGRILFEYNLFKNWPFKNRPLRIDLYTMSTIFESMISVFELFDIDLFTSDLFVFDLGIFNLFKLTISLVELFAINLFPFIHGLLLHASLRIIAHADICLRLSEAVSRSQSYKIIFVLHITKLDIICKLLNHWNTNNVIKIEVKYYPRI